MGICVDVDKLIRLLGPAKCDYWPKKGDKKKYGLSVSQVIDLVRESIDESAEGWAIGEDEQYIRKEFELLMNRIASTRWWAKQEARMLK